jgi:hypothetical protein
MNNFDYDYDYEYESDSINSDVTEVIESYMNQYYPHVDNHTNIIVTQKINHNMTREIQPEYYNEFLAELFTNTDVIKEMVKLVEIQDNNGVNRKKKNYHFCEERLRSFQNCNKSNMNVNTCDLVKAGFYYNGDGTNDSVKCFSCDVELVGWEPSDDPMVEHCKNEPNCKYVKRTYLPMVKRINLK